MPPRVSIIIPAKNRVDLLEQTLASVRAQTYPDWEAIVVDDDSSAESLDATRALVAEDRRIGLLQRTSALGGANACRNQGLRAARGGYVLFLDSDDLLDATCLEGRLQVMEQDGDIGFAVWPGRVFMEVPGDSDFYWSTLTDGDDLIRFLCVDVPWQTSGPLWRRQALVRVGEWDEALASWQDWDFHVRALCASIPYRKLPTADYWIRRGHGSRVSLNFHWRQFRGRERMLAGALRLIKQSGVLRPEHRDAFGGMYWLFARQCAGLGESYGAARRLWGGCFKNGLISRRRYYEGLSLLGLSRLKASLRLDGWITRTWPEYGSIGEAQHCTAALPFRGGREAESQGPQLEIAPA